MAGCKDVAKDFEALKKYKEDVHARPDAHAFIEANIKKNEKAIEQCEKHKMELWESGDYFSSGQFAGDSMVNMGLAPPYKPGPPPTFTADRDQKAPAEFIAG